MAKHHAPPMTMMKSILCHGGFLGLMVIQASCGAFYTYLNNEDQLTERLSIPMGMREVEAALGKPEQVVERDNGNLVVWEYRRYARYHWVKEVLVCPFTAWLGACLFYPSIGIADPLYPPAYYVVLYRDQLCIWGDLETVSASTSCHRSGGKDDNRSIRNPSLKSL